MPPVVEPLALFTNRAVMNRVADAVAPRLETEVLVQGTRSRQRIIGGVSRQRRSEPLRRRELLQGIDVPGHSLSLVHDRPLALLRAERSVGRGPAGELRATVLRVDLPRATMLLAQGVGRLIRNNTDRGVVAVLDTRLAQSSYRSTMFRKLPPMRRTRDRAQVLASFESYANKHESVGSRDSSNFASEKSNKLLLH